MRQSAAAPTAGHAARPGAAPQSLCGPILRRLGPSPAAARRSARTTSWRATMPRTRTQRRSYPG